MRHLHNQSIVFDKSGVQPVNIFVVKPDNIAIRLATDEIRKYNEHLVKRYKDFCTQ